VEGDRGLELTARIGPRPPGKAPVWSVEPARPSTPREHANEGFWLLSCTATAAARVSFDVDIRPRGPGR